MKYNRLLLLQIHIKDTKETLKIPYISIIQYIYGMKVQKKYNVHISVACKKHISVQRGNEMVDKQTDPLELCVDIT